MYITCLILLRDFQIRLKESCYSVTEDNKIPSGSLAAV